LFCVLAPLALADIALAAWLFFQYPASNWIPWGYLGVAAICAGAGGVLSWLKLWPRSKVLPEQLRNGRWPLFGVLSGFLGIGAGVVAAVVAVLVSAWFSNIGTPAAHRVLRITGLTGTYSDVSHFRPARRGLLAPQVPPGRTCSARSGARIPARGSSSSATRCCSPTSGRGGCRTSAPVSCAGSA
jgi:hypothetical protein